MPRLAETAAVAAVVLALTGCSSSSGAEAGEAPAAPVSAAAVPSASPSPSVSVSPSVPAAPVSGSISITCTATADDDTTTTTVFTIPRDSKGGYDFRSLWQAGPQDCTVSGVDGRATAKVKPTTALQKSAYRKSGYDDSNVAALFDICTLTDPDGFYNEPDFAMTQPQVRIFSGVLTICPSHPFAGTWRAAIQRAREQDTGGGDSTGEMVRGVHPGAFCAPAGARGTTSAGTLMTCSRKAGDSRARWRRA